MSPTPSPSGMSDFISALTGTGGLSASTFYGVLSDMVPFIVVAVTVALGFYFIRKAIKGLGNKGKLKI